MMAPSNGFLFVLALLSVQVVAKAGNQQDVDYAVASAKEGLKKWSKTNPSERAKYLFKLARLIQEKLKKALAEDILFGSLAENGGDVYVSESENALQIEIKKDQNKSVKTNSSKTKV